MATGLFNPSNPALQNMLQQIMQNPQAVQSMLSAPYTQSMLQAMAADPDMASTVIGGNPLFASNPELQVYRQQIRRRVEIPIRCSR